MSRSNLALRAGAFALDYLVIAAYLLVLGGAFAVLRIVLPEMSAALFGSPISGQVTGFLVLTLPVALYFALSEASDHQGTVGKRRLGLRVVGIDGHRISLPRSVARSGAKFAPWELAHACIWQSLFAGPNPPAIITVGFVAVYVLIGANLVSAILSARNQSLYDRLTGTIVIRGPSQRRP